MSDAEVITYVSRNYIPVALNLYEIRKAKGVGGKFYAEVARQRPKQYQGLYVVTAEGEVLASRGSQPAKGSWEKDTLKMLKDGIAEFGQVNPRRVRPTDPKPERGAGVCGDGSAVLAVYLRPMVRGLDRRGLGQVALDSVELKKGEFAQFAPGDSERDESWKIDRETVKALHRVLSPNSDANTLVQRDEVSYASLAGRVVRVKDGVAYIRYEGRIAGTHVWQFDPNKGKKIQAEAELSGVGSADAKTGKLLSLTIVADGSFRMFTQDASRYGAVVEWREK